MIFSIFVSKGDLNGKIVVVRFFFCRVYISDMSKILLRNDEIEVFFKAVYTTVC